VVAQRGGRGKCWLPTLFHPTSTLHISHTKNLREWCVAKPQRSAGAHQMSSGENDPNFLSLGTLILGIDLQAIQELLKKSYPARKIRVEKDPSTLSSAINPSDIVLFDFPPPEIFAELKRLKDLTKEQSREIMQLELTAKLTSESIQKFHDNQTELYNEFAILHQKYDDQKAAHASTLWTHCVAHHPDITGIPSEEASNFTETETQVGRYSVGDALGDGQFATVFNCSTKISEEEYALKVILKNKVTSFAALRRVSNEIKILKKLKNRHVIHLIDVIHTKTKLYLITQKGGRDLFDFFENHSDGVKEDWALDIACKIAQAVQYCHVNSICHRDLKPENILIQFDENTGKCIDLKLCDFGLAVRSPAQDLLCDFCGSPGFFAPEMLLNANYQGMKADIWSMGCIFLELLIGNELFWGHWMVAYDVEVLQDKTRFRSEIVTSTEELPEILNFSAMWNSLLITILQVDPGQRPTAEDISAMEWFQASLGEAMPVELLTPTVSFGGEEVLGTNKFLSSPSVSKSMLKTAMNNREKQRTSQLEPSLGMMTAGGGGGEGLSAMLRGMEPQQTPTITKARKIIQRGDDIHKNTSGLDHLPRTLQKPTI
jgi:serine/threonine protein kinase